MPNIVEIVLRAKDDSKGAVQSYTNGIKEIESRIQDLKKIQADAARSMLTQGTATQGWRDSYADLKKAGQDLSSTQKELKDVTDALGISQNEAAKSGKSLFATFTAANLASMAISKGIDFLTTQIGESIKAANQYESSMAGLSSYAVAFGSSAEQARSSAKSLSDDGILPITNSANALKNILSTGLGLDEATKLVATFKDRAAFGRNASIDFGTAVENLAQSFKTEQSELGDASGMTENYSQILQVGAAQMGKNVNQLSTLERAQAKYLGILQLSTASQGDANRYTETAAGQQAKLAYEVNKTQVALGTALQPAVSLVEQSFVDLIQSFAGTDEQMKETQGNIVTLAAMFQQLAIGVVGVGKVIYGGLAYIINGTTDEFVGAVDSTVNQSQQLWENWGKQIERIANGTADSQVDANRQALNQMLSDQIKTQQKINEQTARENESFADAMFKRTRDFKRSMQDMIIDHRDKSRSIQADLAAETAAYDKQVAQRKADYEESLATLDQDHADRVLDIEKQIADERESGYDLDGVIYSQANQKKIDDLQEKLDKENAAYEKSRVKKIAVYNQEVADAKQAHDEKLASLQTELQQELDILKMHAAEVAAVGEATKLDDISRLKRQYAEENAEASKQHGQRLADIQKQGSEAGGVFSTEYLKKMASLQAEIDKTVDKSTADQVARAKESGSAVGNSWWNNFVSTIGNFFKGLPGLISDWITTGVAGIEAKIKSTFSGPLSGAVTTLMKAITGRATGGVTQPGEVTLVGERGPEIAQFPSGTRIYPADQTRQLLSGAGQQSKQVSINIGTVVNQTQMDNAAFWSEMSWQLSL